MKVTKQTLQGLFSLPVKISFVVITVLSALVSWQQINLHRKDQKIVALIGENETLRKNLLSIDGELLEIKDAASDVRLFQKEMIKVMKDIDRNYAVNFASYTSRPEPYSDANILESDPFIAADRSQENIFFLSSSQEKLRYNTANLLGRALSIRDILGKIPSMIPISGGYISSQFGFRRDPLTGTIKKHQGIDFAAPIGTLVYASAEGVVIKAEYNAELGNVVEIKHADGHVSLYGHLSKILTHRSAKLQRGQEIGRVGNTGKRCAGAHLHYGIKKNGVMVDPKQYLLTSPPNFF